MHGSRADYMYSNLIQSRGRGARALQSNQQASPPSNRAQLFEASAPAGDHIIFDAPLFAPTRYYFLVSWVSCFHQNFKRECVRIWEGAISAGPIENGSFADKPLNELFIAAAVFLDYSLTFFLIVEVLLFLQGPCNLQASLGKNVQKHIDTEQRTKGDHIHRLTTVYILRLLRP